MPIVGLARSHRFSLRDLPVAERPTPSISTHATSALPMTHAELELSTMADSSAVGLSASLALLDDVGAHQSS